MFEKVTQVITKDRSVVKTAQVQSTQGKIDQQENTQKASKTDKNDVLVKEEKQIRIQIAELPPQIAIVTSNSPITTRSNSINFNIDLKPCPKPQPTLSLNSKDNVNPVKKPSSLITLSGTAETNNDSPLQSNSVTSRPAKLIKYPKELLNPITLCQHILVNINIKVDSLATYCSNYFVARKIK